MLDVVELHASHGRIPALHGISMTLARGETACLIGANGAGKTTTLRTIAGVHPADSGDIFLDGNNINRLPAHRRVREGISLVPEGRGVFAQLTVDENLRLGAYTRDSGIDEDRERVLELLPRIRERLGQQAGTLSGGEQQMLAIGRALLARPRLLLLDEPSMGLAPIVVEKVFEVIADVARSGVTILLVEQNAHLALEIADRAWVMESGRIALAGNAAALREDPRVREAYLGEAADG
ncbi:ABC transporter ATP-binding protein [Azoarcus taiwanensis]|uniref:ATP-binding cassette domain-containing protein n=1 Tax=Azoarcus taiwanensis TaxID=666964 RepID=A0A972F6X4_9RHOO|nr:ABC transporter ATP-binding protein [Azoarcus taiwanensis]NMG02711.1 ATP-binding cassette domain-containing protein [Azoarcus taiwanensis]